MAATIIGSFCSSLIPKRRFIKSRNLASRPLRSATIRAASSLAETQPIEHPLHGGTVDFCAIFFNPPVNKYSIEFETGWFDAATTTTTKPFIPGCRPVDNLLDLNVKLITDQREPTHDSGRYKRLAGKLNIVTVTRPDIAYPDLTVDAKVSTRRNCLACPICYYPLINKSEQIITPTSGSKIECSTCKKSYLGNDIYLDLTLSGGFKEYDETMPAATELFRTPLVSFLYERGWRQNFVWGGFPGPEKEFEMAKGYLKPTIGGTIVDASCGSGLFSRLFAKSGMYSLVVALDFSENMLRQCDEFIKQENILKENLVLVRADISRLPFATSSVDAVHAGAALQCWPSPSAAVAEISRVLRPGGVFVATTFILDIFFPVVPVIRAVRQIYTRASSNNLFLSEGELEDLCRACGLVGFTCTRNGPFVMLAATKPPGSSFG